VGNNKYSAELKFSQDIELSLDAESELPTFEMLAYSGAEIAQGFTSLPIIVDLAGMKTNRKPKLPILLDHDGKKPVGHSTSIEKSDRDLRVSGVISSVSEDAKNLIQATKNGMPYEASIGAKVISYKELKANQTKEVNGRIIKGPALIASKTLLKEISFVSLGADDATEASIAASEINYTPKKGNIEMNLNAWLQAKNIEGFESLDPAVQDAIKLQFESETAPAAAAPEAAPAVELSDIKETLELIKAEKFDLELRSLCGDNQELYLEAKANGYSVEVVKAKLEVAETKKQYEAIKASSESFNSGFGIQVKRGKSEASGKSVEAAIAMSLGVSEDLLLNPKKNLAEGKAQAVGSDRHLRLSEQEIDEAQHFKGLGIKALFAEKARANGHTSFDVDESTIRAALGGELKLETAFSRVDLPTLFTNVLDRVMMKDYDMVPTTWDKISTTSSVKDFREVDRVRFGGLNMWSQVAADGKLTQGHFENEESFEALFNRLLNDGVYYDNSAYYSTSGIINDKTSSAFSLASLDAVDDAIRNRKHPTMGKNRKNSQGGDSYSPFIKTPMTRLLLPSELAREAQRLLSQSVLHNVDDSAQSANELISTVNYHAGRYEIVESPYISDPMWGGSNALATTWYMMANKQMLSTIDFVFLNGVQRPVIEPTVNLTGEHLGISIRGIYDFGANFVDKHASFRCKA
jgi:uncharacterized protein (UPF0335 family)